MEDRSPSSSNTAEKAHSPGAQKQAACLTCRRSKTRCLRETGDSKCKKCAQANVECIVPDYRVGRKKGIKNKRDGLEKAVYRIEQEIKRSKTRGSEADDDRNPYLLQTLLTEAQGILPSENQGRVGSVSRPVGTLQSSSYQQNTQFHQSQTNIEPSGDQSSEDHFPVDDAENPLQLLARASDLSVPTNSVSYAPNVPSPASIPPRPNTSHDEGLHTFFGPFRPSLDVGPEIDPVEMGFVTEEETVTLFKYFFDHLAHTRWGVDPRIHTPDFVRQQSAFLFTSILAASALFIPTAAALSKRLSTHCKHLARNIMFNRNRSPEIVLAFMVNVPWMAPGKHWSDDETCSYMAMALTVAMDISLNKLIVPSPSDSVAGIHIGRPPSDCITARKALDLDGFPNVDPLSNYGKRLLRRRERIWLALFVLDRGVCLARGRTFTVPITTIIEHCDEWHKSPISDVWDGSIVSSAVLRRDLVDLIADVKKTCDSNNIHAISGSTIAQTLQDMINGFFNRWYATWAFAIGGMRDGSIPPYVEILVTHGRLSLFSAVFNHPNAPNEVKRFFRAAGLSSSLNVLRAAVQGENRLKSMPNNTAIMISFAACFAFYLSTTGSSRNMSLAPSIRKLIEESADVLEKIGTTPSHRNATSALYGRHLREVVATAPPPSNHVEDLPQQEQPQITYPINQDGPMQNLQNYQTGTDLTPMHMSELLQFSAMSDNQINEAINNAGAELEHYLPPDFSMEEKNGLDWLDWFNLETSTYGM